MFFIVVKSNILCSSGVVGIFLVGGGTVYDKKKEKKESRVHSHTHTRAHSEEVSFLAKYGNWS